MKIKCKKCGKRFEQDMYSGLCPKCGTYNGAHMSDGAAEQYFDSGRFGEAAHQELHERYGDTGHAADAHRKLHENYDEGYEAAHPATGGAAAPFGGKGLMLFRLALLFFIIFVPTVCFIHYQLWEKALVEEVGSGEIGHVELTDGDSLIFDAEDFDAPVRVTAYGYELVEAEQLEEKDKVLAVVKGSAESADYSFDAKISCISLEYEYKGHTFYQLPLDRYSLEEASWLKVSREQLLNSYSLGNGTYEEGYWFFCVPKEAKLLGLTVAACRGSGTQSAFLEGTIPLAPVAEPVFSKEGTEQ